MSKDDVEVAQEVSEEAKDDTRSESAGSDFHCLYHFTCCVCTSVLHGSESWPVRKENVVALQ